MKKTEQYTFCYCDCGNELVSSNCVIAEDEDGTVIYECPKCRAITYWYFGAPAPIKLKRDTEETA